MPSCFGALGVLLLVLAFCWRSLHHTEMATALFCLACCCRLVFLVDDFCELLRRSQTISQTFHGLVAYSVKVQEDHFSVEGFPLEHTFWSSKCCLAASLFGFCVKAPATILILSNNSHRAIHNIAGGKVLSQPFLCLMTFP